MLYQSYTAPKPRILQRIVLAYMFAMTPLLSQNVLYVWMTLPAREWYDGRFSSRFGVLLSPLMLATLDICG